MFTKDVRRQLGCGYEPPLDGSRPYWPPGATPREVPAGEWAGPTICVGYTTKLPMVRERTWQRLHWERGTLTDKLGHSPTDEDFDHLEILEEAIGACQSWALTNPAKKAAP